MATITSTTKFPVGQADVMIGAAAAPLLASAVTFSAQPTTLDVPVYQFGPGAVEKIVTGWEVSVTFSIAEESHEAWQLALPLFKAGTGPTETLTDVAVGTGLRAIGKEITIHPQLMGTDKSGDITIYKAIPNGGIQRVYGLEIGNYQVTFQALVKDGAVSGTAGNYFLIGPKSV